MGECVTHGLGSKSAAPTLTASGIRTSESEI